MICKHPAYRIVGGRLVCIRCGRPWDGKTIEDKIDSAHETK